MDKLANICLALGFLIGGHLALAGEPVDRPACRTGSGWSAPVASPKTVLLVPLLRGFPDENEPETWPNHPAAQLARFYQSRFRAETARLLGIRTWNGFLEKARRLRERGEAFDRIILIGHGGLDGPVLNEDMIVRERTEDGAEAHAIRILEAQPGLADTLTITYDTVNNPAFAAALVRRWEKLAEEDPDDVERTLRQLESRLEPPDAACFAYHCPATLLDSIRSPAERESKQQVCQWVCRRPLFQSHWEERADPGRFARYAESLAALAKPGALIFIGSCNPGTKLSKLTDPRDTGGLLPSSTMAGGPHETYLHLLAAATGRFAAGPIGQASARDIVERIMGLETGGSPRYLRLVAPPVKCPPDS
jgi:hypothetical protein